MRDYQDKNGNQRRVYEVNVQGFYFGDSAKPQQSQQQTPQQGFPQQGYAPQQPAQKQYQQQDAFSNMGTQVPFDEEVPF